MGDPKECVRSSLRWLHDMALFYEELQAFLRTLPADVQIDTLVDVPHHIAEDPSFRNLCRVSR